MKIVLGCISFKDLTGSEIYYYELGKALQRAGHSITIYAAVTGEGALLEFMKKEKASLEVKNIKDFDYSTEEEIDTVICSHKGVTDFFCDLKKKHGLKYNIIDVCHSEYSGLERPCQREEIDYYVAIRPAIKDRLINLYKIEEKKVSMIWNPFNMERFHYEKRETFDLENGKDYKILMHGTIDQFRKPIIESMANFCRDKGWELTLLGKDHGDYLGALLEEYKGIVKHHDAVENPEEFIKKADATCSVYIGRSTIEGWLCGVPGFVYTVDERGSITACNLHFPPNDLSVYDENNTAKSFLGIIEKLNSRMEGVLVSVLRENLGNMLFQIGAGATIAKKAGKELRVAPAVGFMEHWNKNMGYFHSRVNQLERMPDFNDGTWCINNEPSYQKPMPNFDCSKPNVLMVGMWQSEAYLDADLVRGVFRCDDDLKKKIEEEYGDLSEYVCINVRRGDFLEKPDTFIVPTKKWYKRCYTKYFKGQKALICSDDIEWCKKNLKIKGAVYVEGHTPVERLFICSFCKDHIIDTSTFGWWCAWLNERPESKVVTCDRRWSYVSPLSTAWRVPPRWIKEPLNDDVEKNIDPTLLVCAIGKSENHYIREWVEHYKNIGATKIVLYDNNDIDGERFEEVIKDYIDSGFVKIVDVRGMTAMQTRVYQHCYDNYSSDYTWTAFFDIDEFLEIEGYDSVIELLKDSRYEGYEAILPCWKNYDDNDLLKVENGDYSRKRFTRVAELPFDNTVFKTMIRGGLPDIEAATPHNIGNSAITRCDMEGNPVEWGGGERFNLPKITWNNAFLAHYRCKTVEEYVLNKRKRGFPSGNPDTARLLKLGAYFWQYNKKTKEKEDLFNELISHEQGE